MISANVTPNKRQFDWVPSPELVAQSNLSAFLASVGEPDYASLLARSTADPAWLMERVFEFCDTRFYRRWTRGSAHSRSPRGCAIAEPAS